MVLAFRRRSGFLTVFILAGISAIESQQSGVAPDLRQSSPPRVVKPVGEEEVKLTCYVKYAQNYTWYKNHKKIHQPADRYVVKTPRYLRITDVLKSDSGTFVCIASNKYGTVNCTIRLIVEDPTVSPTNVSGAVKPHFLYPDKMAKATAKLEYTEGDKFQLNCDAKGTPTPTVTWYRGKEIYRGSRSDETITPGRYHYVIYFNGVDVKDAGNYTCVVKNSYGTLTHSYDFDVKEKIRSFPQILSIWEQKKPEYAGTDLQMHAIVLSKDENTKFFWYFSKSFHPDETNLGTLINQTLSESRLETPPSSGVSWLKWKVVLNLKNLSVADSGSYSCQAENIVGTVQRQTPLNVTTRPITPSPSEKSRVLPQILSIWEQKKPEYAGTDLQMHAIVLSKHTNTKFFWYFSKSFVPDETNLGTLINQTLFKSRLETPPSSGVSWLKWKVVLNLKNLSVADSGSYWCQAENILGTAVQRQTSLKVTARPITPSPSERAHAEPVVLPMENVTVYRGENASLTCKALSDSMPHFQWLRWFPVRSNGSANSSVNGSIEIPHYEIVDKEDTDQYVIVPPSSGKKFDFHRVKLTFVNVTKKDEGKYTCIVGNAVGYAVEHAYIIVQNIDKAKPNEAQRTESTTDGSTVSLTSISSESEAVTQTSMGWTDRIRYPVAVIAVPVGVVVLLIIASGLFYWQMKKGRASSSATMKSRRNIGSLQVKYVVQSNEYVIVPDLKGLGNDFGTN